MDTIQESSVPQGSNDALRSADMTDLLSRKSTRLSYFALPIYLAILLLLFTAAWFIKYPEVVSSRVTIIAYNMPKEILTKQEGRLVKLFKKNGDTISTGVVIAYIESTASHEQVIDLNGKIDSAVKLLRQDKNLISPGYFGSRYDSLGELQQAYQQFTTAFQSFTDYIGDGFYIKNERPSHKMSMFWKRIG